MSKKSRTIIEHRFYELPIDIPAILLDGDKWYISDVRSSRMHFHNCLELGFCHSGESLIEFDNNTIVTVNAGDCTIIPRHIPHTTYSKHGSKSLWSYIFIDFKAILADKLIQIPDSYSLLDDFLRESCVITPQAFPDICYLANSLLEEMRQKKTDWTVVFKTTAAALLFRINRMYQQVKQTQLNAPSNNQYFELKIAIDYIQENYTQKIAIIELANLCHLSENHFRRLFLNAMGTSPLNYINFTRINQACILLNNSNQTILDIANNVGFHSIASFNRNFKEILGLRPKDYRSRTVKDSDKHLYQRFIQDYVGWTEAEHFPH